MVPPNPDAFISEALSRRGPGELPYSGEFAFLVHQHLLELVADFPALRLKTQSYTHIDGRTSLLLCAEGTVPMHYGGHKYNIPMAIWLPDKYPLQRPIVYVVPTHSMIIKPRHPFVDGSGLVSSPYLKQWAYPRSNLHEMAQDMSMLFGSDPPLYSKPPGWTGPLSGSSSGPMNTSDSGEGAAIGTTSSSSVIGAASTSYGTCSAASNMSGDAFVNPMMQGTGSGIFTAAPGLGGVSGSSCGLWTGAVVAAEAAKPGPGPRQQQEGVAGPQPENSQASLLSAFRSTAMAEVSRRLQASLEAMASQATADIQLHMNLQVELKQRQAILEQGVQGLQAERLALDKLAHDLVASNLQLDAWLADNEPRATAFQVGSLEPDDLLTAADLLSQQALEVQAEDLALEDCLYALDKAMQDGSVAPDAYLRQARTVCRRQFTARILGIKIAATQQERQRYGLTALTSDPEATSSGLSAPPRMALPQGDSWSSTGMLTNSLTAAR